MSTPGLILAGRYRLRRELGHGPTTSVWCADDPVLDREVAVRILHPLFARDPDAIERFRARATRASRLAHPGVAAVYEVVADTDRAYAVVEFVDGPDLRTHIDTIGRLSTSEAAEVAAQIAATLAHVHQEGLTHLGLGPSSVILGPHGRARIVDLGLGPDGLFDADSTDAGAIAGRAQYLAPEQIRGEATSTSTDVFALGLLLYEMLTGAPARAAAAATNVAACATTAIPSIGRVQRDIPPRLGALIDRAVAPHPRDRPEADVLAAALGPFRRDATPPGGTPTTTVATPSPRTAPQRSSRRTAAAVALTLIAVFAAVAAIFLTARDSPSESPTTTIPRGSEPVAIRAAHAFDPAGDRVEHDDRVVFIFDGDPTTAWDSETYSSREFGGGKPGVGIVLDLGEVSDISQITVSGSPGWDGEVAVADTESEDRTGWGEPVARVTDAPSLVVFELPATAGRYVLLWFTHLPPSRQLEIRSVDVKH